MDEMNQTGNYQLNQWELADRIQMEDFNGDNSKIDAALKGQAEALAEEPLCAFLPTFGTIIIFIHIFLQLLAQTVLCRPMLHCWLAATPSTGNDAALLLLLYCKNSSFACL